MSSRIVTGKPSASLLFALNAAVARSLPTALKCLATVSTIALMCEAPAYAQSTLTANFSRGAIAEYTNNPNGTSNGALFSSLSIARISVSQISSTGSWGGSQGNDTAVSATITFSNGTTVTFPAAINWVKNAGGGQFDWMGLTIGSGVTVNDGYSLSSGSSKTYILQFPQSSLNLSTLLPNQLDGSANAGAAINALNLYFPNATPPMITGPSGGAGASTSALSVNESQTAVTTLTADKPVTWAITGGTDQGRFAISSNGVITFLAAPDFEMPTDSDTNNSYALTVTATDGNANTSTQTITVTVLDLDDTAPVVADQSFSYAENQASGATVGTVAASDAVGVTGFRFATTGTTTSADGFYTIDATGAIKLTAPGAAAGAATNDFEITPNSFTYAVQARDAAGNWSASATITLGVTDLNDVAPMITGPSGGAGASTSALSVNESQTAVTTLTADKPVTWAITGGTDQGRFAISSNGVITFLAAPDFEMPTDSDTNNSYALTVTATDGNANTSTQTITVTVLDLDDTAPVITGPGGMTGASSAITVGEGQTTVTQLTANVPISTWQIAGGNDSGRFTIDASGQIAFVSAPDFEMPVDSDTNNTYVLVVEAIDGNGNRTLQTVTVTVADVDDQAPAITGPSGGPGAVASAISVSEGTTAVTIVAANVVVAWAIIGGNDGGQFTITPGGAITFVAEPNFEAPTDSDRNNTYVLVIEARDTNGNTATQTITVTVSNVDEIRHRLDEIGDTLRGDLRN